MNCNHSQLQPLSQQAWIANKLDAQSQQKLATRALKAVERILFGTAKQVRFKVPTCFKSVEGKSNKQGFHYQVFFWFKAPGKGRGLYSNQSP